VLLLASSFQLLVQTRTAHACQTQREYVIKQVCAAAFTHAAQWLFEANVQFDESGSRDSRRQLASHLLRVINSAGANTRTIKKIGSQNSQGNNLMQVADMLCGSVARAYERNEGIEDKEDFRRIIRARELWVAEWPD
jgi:hypothetical protein